MANIPGDPPPLEFLDDPHSVEMFADGWAGLFVFNGNLRITLEALQMNHAPNPGTIRRVVVGRVVMPIDIAEALARGIIEFVERRRAEPEANAQGTPTVQ